MHCPQAGYLKRKEKKNQKLRQTHFTVSQALAFQRADAFQQGTQTSLAVVQSV